MPRPIDTRARVLGPYRTRSGHWKVTTVDAGTTPAAERSRHRFFATKAEAFDWIKIEVEAVAKRAGRTIDASITDYHQHLIDKGNQEASAAETCRRVRLFFPVLAAPLTSVTEQRAREYYRAFAHRTYEVGPAGARRKKQVSVEFQRNALSQVKTFMRWCAAQKWISGSPVESIKGIGRRARGKLQLTNDEAARFLAVALRDGEIGAAMLLLLGLRQGEVRTRQVRDLDASGTVLQIPDAKTKAGVGYVEIPEVLQAPLLDLARGRKATEPLFSTARGGYHTKSWLLAAVRRVCKRAGVPVVAPHGLRGTFSSVAHRAGVASHVVAQQLGHGDKRVTLDSYTDPGAVRAAKQRRILRVLKGGRR